eukprot:scaffold1872_cov268-Chaetoceros_neogracile.AAC.17
MFIKKDLRKIPIIFSDAKEAYEKDPSDKLVELRLARRPAEFKQGSIAPLCQPHYIPSLIHLQKLSLYDCQISTLEGIQFLADSCPILEEMNLGRNPLKSLPSELGSMKALKSLSLDDCEILRMSNNFITKVDGEKLDTWKGMEVLCLDGNLIEQVPAEMQCLIKLKVLMLRKNKIKYLPYGVPGSTHMELTLFHISTNDLEALPSSIAQCPSLKMIYANSNKIVQIPLDLAKMQSLEHCNLGNNAIIQLDDEFLERFGTPNAKDGKCTKDEKVNMQLEQNPVSKVDKSQQDASAMEVC